MEIRRDALRGSLRNARNRRASATGEPPRGLSLSPSPLSPNPASPPTRAPHASASIPPTHLSLHRRPKRLDVPALRALCTDRNPDDLPPAADRGGEIRLARSIDALGPCQVVRVDVAR